VASEDLTIGAEEREGRIRLVLQGRLTLAEGDAFWSHMRTVQAARVDELDVAGLRSLDGGGAALLLAAAARMERSGSLPQIVGATGDVAKLLDLYRCADGKQCLSAEERSKSFLAEIGDSAYDVWRQVRDILAFTGDLVVGLFAAAKRPRTVHLRELGALMERAGANSVPIIVVIHFLIGAILGLQGAMQLHRFGADAFLANLVGLSVVRELGPLMTAIVVAGRSGAAYAAELGTMQVGEEVDALRTLGQDPQRFLVFPRVLALFLVVPLLTAIADLVACLGGMFIGMVELGIPPVAYMRQLQSAVVMSDVGTGLLKSGFFAVLIGLVACQRGLQTRGGAQGVGSSTTSAVVVVLFGLVFLDAVFTMVFRLLGW